MILLYSLLILTLPTIIVLNVLLYHIIVRRALKKYIKPKLKDNGFTFLNYKWPGLFSNGDFKNDKITLTVMSKNGSVVSSTYAYIYYHKFNDTKKVTVRIGTTFLIIYKVDFSSEL